MSVEEVDELGNHHDKITLVIALSGQNPLDRQGNWWVWVGEKQDVCMIPKMKCIGRSGSSFGEPSVEG